MFLQPSIHEKFSGTRKRQKDTLYLCFDTQETRDFRNSVFDVTTAILYL